MIGIVVGNLLVTIALAAMIIVLYTQIDRQWSKIRRQEAVLRQISKKMEQDKVQLIETWNHAEKALIRADSNTRNLHDIETAVRKLQGWPEVSKDV